MAVQIKPPTLHDLLSDYPDVFPAYMADPVGLTSPVGLTRPGAWRLWAATAKGGWLTKVYDAYPWNSVQKLLNDTRVRDVSIVSTRVFFGPPGMWEEYKVKVPARGTTPARIEVRERWVPTFHWDTGLDWCARCRRPSLFRVWSADHHALRLQPCLADDSPQRCYYCGIRRAAMPHDPYTIED